MSNFNNTEFNIKFISSGDERTLSRMDKDESNRFLTEVGRVTYKGQFVCAAYWCTINDHLDISHENEQSKHLKSVIESLMND